MFSSVLLSTPLKNLPKVISPAGNEKIDLFGYRIDEENTVGYEPTKGYTINDVSSLAFRSKES
ncbi:MAG: hypothetical protein LBR68_07075 [Lachnoclostridium sp.]|nr:hypothetical protein [Lachnoclostridium sp.]